MKKPRHALTLILAAAILWPAPAPAADNRKVYVRLYSSIIECSNMGSGNVVTFTLLARNLAVKGKTISKADTSGEIFASFPQSQFILPGDTVRVEESGYGTRAHRLEDVVLTDLSPAADTVSGRVTAGRTRAEIDVRSWTPEGDSVMVRNLTVPPGADGGFAANLHQLWTIDLKRNDEVSIGYGQGIFHIRRLCPVPGLRTTVGTNEANLVGTLGSPYLVRLATSSGITRGVARTTPVEGEGIMGRVSFNQPAGAPRRILTGNTVNVSGPWGFTTTVKPLQVTAVDTATDMITIRTVPRTPVEVRVTLFNSDGSFRDSHTSIPRPVSGPAGVIRYSCPKDIRQFDEIRLHMRDATGDFYSTTYQVP